MGRGVSGPVRSTSRIWRMGITAALTDLALYLVWVAIPYRAIHLGAGAVELGLLSTISSGTYVLTTLFTGSLSDRVPRLYLARFGALVFAGGCVLILRAPSLGQLLPRLPLSGLGMGFFWPAVQAALADEGSLDELESNLGLFNVFWSGGKALGFLVGGSLYALYGVTPILIGVPVTMLVVTALLPRRQRTIPAAPRPGDAGDDPAAETYRLPAGNDLRALLYMAWAANAVAFGIGNTLNMQYPKFLLENGRGSAVFGLFLGTIFIVQTLVFWGLRTRHGWRFRRRHVYTVQVATAVGTLLLIWAHPVWLILLVAVPLGLGLGLCYHASIVYSLLDRSGRGRRAGFHEALLGAGNFVLPLLGGLAASAASDLRMPYLLCGAIALLGIGFQELIWRRRDAHARAI
jgi:MFS family permease